MNAAQLDTVFDPLAWGMALLILVVLFLTIVRFTKPWQRWRQPVAKFTFLAFGVTCIGLGTSFVLSKYDFLNFIGGAIGVFGFQLTVAQIERRSQRDGPEPISSIAYPQGYESLAQLDLEAIDVGEETDEQTQFSPDELQELIKTQALELRKAAQDFPPFLRGSASFLQDHLHYLQLYLNLLKLNLLKPEQSPQLRFRDEYDIVAFLVHQINGYDNCPRIEIISNIPNWKTQDLRAITFALQRQVANGSSVSWLTKRPHSKAEVEAFFQLTSSGIACRALIPTRAEINHPQAIDRFFALFLFSGLQPMQIIVQDHDSTVSISSWSPAVEDERMRFARLWELGRVPNNIHPHDPPSGQSQTSEAPRARRRGGARSARRSTDAGEQPPPRL